MCRDNREDMCVGMLVDMCVDMYGHVCRHTYIWGLFIHVNRHVVLTCLHTRSAGVGARMCGWAHVLRCIRARMCGRGGVASSAQHHREDGPTSRLVHVSMGKEQCAVVVSLFRMKLWVVEVDTESGLRSPCRWVLCNEVCYVGMEETKKAEGQGHVHIQKTRKSGN